MSRIEKLLIYDATNSRSTTHVFIARPSPAEERTLGKLGFVAEIASANRINQELLSRLQDFLKAAYYTSPEVNPEVAFEHTIQACNRYLGELIGDFGTDWVDNFSMVIFSLREQIVHFADSGKLLGFLIHDKKVVDMLGNRNRLQKVNPIKMFTSIASGELKSNDAIIFSTANILDYFSIEKLRLSITEMPLGGSAQNLEETLRQNPNNDAFASIILRGQNIEAPLTSTVEKRPTQNIIGAPKRSIDNMLSQNAQTQELLTPSLWPAIKKGIKKISREAKILFRAWILRKPTRISSVLENEEINFEKQNRNTNGQVIPASRSRFIAKAVRKTIFSKIPNFLWQRSRQAIQATPKLFNSIRSIGNNLKRTPQQIPVAIERQVNTVKGLPQKSRRLFFGTVILAVIVAIALIIAGVQRQRSSTSTAVNNKITTIQNDIDTAKSALLYGDEDRVKSLLADAKQLTNTLPNESKSDKSRQSTLLADIETVLSKTRHEIKPEFKNLATLKTEIKPTGLVLLGKSLFTVDSANNQLISINNATGEQKNLAILPGNPDITELTNFGSGSLSALTSNLEIIDQKPNTAKGTRYGLVLPNTNANLAGFVNYNTALYSIDIANNLILKASRQGPGYKAVSWLKEALKLDSAVDLSVDGSLYVLTNKGEVMKFTQGQRVQLAMSAVEPALTSAKKIVADATLQNIYILDPTLKRIVVFSKAGKFVNQYVGDALATTTSFTADEHAKKIYVLNGNNIQSINIQ
jgi:hypothetical protein